VDWFFAWLDGIFACDDFKNAQVVKAVKDFSPITVTKRK
jgi:hypothetical protein